MWSSCVTNYESIYLENKNAFNDIAPNLINDFDYLRLNNYCGLDSSSGTLIIRGVTDNCLSGFSDDVHGIINDLFNDGLIIGIELFENYLYINLATKKNLRNTFSYFLVYTTDV